VGTRGFLPGGVDDPIVPDPVETLRLLVEAAVAIAGFSGVVVVFGQRLAGDYGCSQSPATRSISFSPLWVEVRPPPKRGAAEMAR
jgi:hypothetical protein